MHHASRPDGLRLQHLKSNTFKVTFRIGHRRYRFADGRSIGLPLRPNRVSPRHRKEAATELLLAFKQALDRGWRPDLDERPVTLQELLSNYSPASDHSKKYRKAMVTTRDGFQAFLQRKGKQFFSLPQLNSDIVQEYLSGFLTPSTFNHERKRLSAILKLAYATAGLPNPITQIPKRREKATLQQLLVAGGQIHKSRLTHPIVL